MQISLSSKQELGTGTKALLQISLNISISMVVAFQPKFHSKQVIDEFVDEANLIRQQNIQ